MSRLGVEHDTPNSPSATSAPSLDRLHNFDQAWQLRCEAFAKVSDHVAALLRFTSAEGKVAAMPART